MKHVIYTLKPAPLNINGHAFQPHEDTGGIVTVNPIEDAAADYFAGIPGYAVWDADEDGAPVKPKRKPGRPKAEKAADADADGATE